MAGGSQHSKGLHHFHKRKRIHQKHEPYPHPNKLKRFIDKFIYVVSIIGMVFTIPQITKIWIGKTAAGVSLISWVSYLFGAVFWLAYGILHKEKPIIFSYSIWILLEISIILGILVYR